MLDLEVCYYNLTLPPSEYYTSKNRIIRESLQQPVEKSFII